MSDFAANLNLAILRQLDPAELTLVVPTGERVPLRLVEITDLGRRPAGFQAPGGATVREECFSLVFEGPPEPALPQGTWQLEHPQLGSGEIFLVPIAAGAPVLAVAAPTPDGPRRYEAVFY